MWKWMNKFTFRKRKLVPSLFLHTSRVDIWVIDISLQKIFPNKEDYEIMSGTDPLDDRIIVKWPEKLTPEERKKIAKLKKHLGSSTADAGKDTLSLALNDAPEASVGEPALQQGTTAATPSLPSERYTPPGRRQKSQVLIY